MRAPKTLAPGTVQRNWFRELDPRTEFCPAQGPPGGAPSLAVKRAGQRPYIVFDHRNVSGSFALFVRQGVGKQGPAGLGSGLRRNAADQPVVAHIFKEYRRD